MYWYALCNNTTEISIWPLNVCNCDFEFYVVQMAKKIPYNWLKHEATYSHNIIQHN